MVRKESIHRFCQMLCWQDPLHSEDSPKILWRHVYILWIAFTLSLFIIITFITISFIHFHCDLSWTRDWILSSLKVGSEPKAPEKPNKVIWDQTRHPFLCLSVSICFNATRDQARQVLCPILEFLMISKPGAYPGIRGSSHWTGWGIWLLGHPGRIHCHDSGAVLWFDNKYSPTEQAIKALKEEGIDTVVINPNVATVQVFRFNITNNSTGSKKNQSWCQQE